MSFDDNRGQMEESEKMTIASDIDETIGMASVTGNKDTDISGDATDDAKANDGNNDDVAKDGHGSDGHLAADAGGDGSASIMTGSDSMSDIGNTTRSDDDVTGLVTDGNAQADLADFVIPLETAPDLDDNDGNDDTGESGDVTADVLDGDKGTVVTDIGTTVARASREAFGKARGFVTRTVQAVRGGDEPQTGGVMAMEDGAMTNLQANGIADCDTDENQTYASDKKGNASTVDAGADESDASTMHGNGGKKVVESDADEKHDDMLSDGDGSHEWMKSEGIDISDRACDDDTITVGEPVAVGVKPIEYDDTGIRKSQRKHRLSGTHVGPDGRDRIDNDPYLGGIITAMLIIALTLACMVAGLVSKRTQAKNSEVVAANAITVENANAGIDENNGNVDKNAMSDDGSSKNLNKNSNTSSNKNSKKSKDDISNNTNKSATASKKSSSDNDTEVLKKTGDVMLLDEGIVQTEGWSVTIPSAWKGDTKAVMRDGGIVEVKLNAQDDDDDLCLLTIMVSDGSEPQSAGDVATQLVAYKVASDGSKHLEVWADNMPYRACQDDSSGFSHGESIWDHLVSLATDKRITSQAQARNYGVDRIAMEEYDYINPLIKDGISFN